MNIWNSIKLHKLAIIMASMSLTMLISSTNALAALSSSTYSSLPPTSLSSSSNTTPLVMLVMSNDHQLYYKAYNDWSDLDNDGTIDHTYNHNIDYYGYFDAYKCYDYDSGDGRFEPQAITADKYCTGAGLNNTWSGNFLNWATMTRMDILRKVLFGGKRVEDDIDDTTLERAYLPSDAHSFAKFVDAAVINIDNLTPFAAGQSLTFCNTTYNSSTTEESQNTTQPPLVRVAQGDYRYWAANERWQCTWDDERGDNYNGTANYPPTAATDDPNRAADGATYGGNGPDFIVRVEACDDNFIGLDKERCKSYTSSAGTSYKPVGLLHTHGESEAIKFGLLTGSYQRNKSGGVVRKDISLFTDELRKGTAGNFTGQFDTSVDGIVASISKMRISRYQYSDGYYNGTDDCPWGLTSFTDGDCSNWGNPASEMYLEAVRYFAGLNANASFSANDTGYIPGLQNVGNWNDPLDVNNYCAACNIVMLNTSDFSYDDDALSMAGLLGSPSATALTKNIGDKEGITNNQWFVGESGGVTDQLCTAKTITDLGTVKGICPGSPRLQGTYNMAGIAHWAHTNDIRTLTGEQKVNTYAVALAPAVPKIEIPVPGGAAGQTVTILPACRNSDLTPNANCAIVDFKVADPHQDLGGGTYFGSFYVNWEDSEQGGDYDMDMKGLIYYLINSTTVQINTLVDYKAGSYPMGFGYIISGTTNDGFRVHAGVDGFTYTDPDGLNDCSAGCNLGDGWTTQNYAIGSSTANLPKDPLHYVAKWGGFTDINNNDEPDLQAEWDSQNNSDGSNGADGLPDNYFLATNPGTLENRLSRVLSSIAERLSAGTAAAVIANNTAGTGILTQALYQPSFSSSNGSSITWAGFMHGIFLDNLGNLREDTNKNDQLDDYATDKVIRYIYDTNLNRTRIVRYDTNDGVTLLPLDVIELEDLGSVWNARNELSKLNNNDIITQRPYNTTVSTANTRHILTWLDGNHNGIVDVGETLENFDSSTFTTAKSNLGYLNLQSDTNADTLINETDALNIVNYIRGQENVPGTNFRNRSVDFDNDGANEVWRLGDIVHSSPAIAEAPAQVWDRYGDTSYTTFRSQYAKRRQVIYVGANDGMLHAFNGGFINTANRRYDLTRAQESHETSPPTAHPLGAELWAYVPKNSLPHLQWLTEINYPHVYYVDGRTQIFDVNIFSDDIDHPGGWGTILVATMRLGGGSDDPVNPTTIPVDVDNTDGDFDGATNTDFTARSAILIFDVTNPEKPPVLLGEVTHPQLGFTTSTPNIVAAREANLFGDWSNPSINEWFLVFGSGPTDLKTATSNQAPYMYALNLKSIDSGILDLTQKTIPVPTSVDTALLPAGDGIGNAFVGEPHTEDWNRDYKYDTVYFGLDSTNASSIPYDTGGALMRMQMTGPSPSTDWTINTVIDLDQAFNAKPTTTKDTGELWVYGGTGRLFLKDDNTTTSVESFIGVREKVDNLTGEPLPTTFSKSNSTNPMNDELQNTTNIQIFANGSLLDPDGRVPATVVNFDLLRGHIQTTGGWYFDFDSSADSPHRRNFTRSIIFSRQLLFTTYNPPIDTCLPEGTSNLYAIYYSTGTAYPDAAFGNSTTNFNNGSPETPNNIDLGIGVASEPVMLPGDKVAVQKSTSETIDVKVKRTGMVSSGRRSWREIQINW